MRILPVVIVVAFVGLMILTFIPPPQSAVDLARDHGFSEQVIADGRQFSFERRMFMWGETLLELAWLLALVFGGWGKRIADRCNSVARGRWLPTLLMLGVCLYLAQALIHLPFGVGRWAHLTAWKMTTQPLSAWFTEHLLALAVNAVVEGIVVVGLYLLLRWLPRWWWLAATAGSVGLAALFAFLWPIVISPLFNTFTPIGRTQWAEWEQPLASIVKQANVPLDEILVMNASAQSEHSNAYYAGFAGTRRIVIYDNLLKNHPLPEVESILAHEIGHWLHDHIVKGIALGGAAALLGFYLLSRLLIWAKDAFGLHAPHDPASLPVILLAGFVGSWLVMPVGNAVSRHFERQADMMALDLARDPAVFIEAEKKLAIKNIGNVAPAPWNVWLFATHPPTVERIEMAIQWKRGHP